MGATSLSHDKAANDAGLVRFEDAVLLLDEVERLRSELARSEARLAELDAVAHIDTLVNLPNRRRFLASLERTIARVRRSGGEAALIFVDVDGLKAINDGFGHKAGDEALVQVARLLVQCVRTSDLVGRLSGDEFAILLASSDQLNAWQTALRVVETVEDCQFCTGGECLALSVAVGVAMIRPDDDTADVLARADREMYRIKNIGRGPTALVRDRTRA
jgi:diguanylate cyclase (GGDEF)-like protein